MSSLKFSLEGSLYIINTSFLLDIQFANIFSPAYNLFFILFTWALEEQMFLILMRSSLSVFQLWIMLLISRRRTLCIVLDYKAEKAMAPHSSTLAWEIPWAEEPGRLQSMGSWRVRHDWVTSLSLFTFMCWRRKWQPTPMFLPGESQGRGTCWAAICGVTQSRTWLKWLSSSRNEQLR